MGLRGPHAGASTSGARGEAALGPAPINWDFAIPCLRPGGREALVYWVEIHPAHGHGITEVTKKAMWLRGCLSSDGERRKPFGNTLVWIASGKVSFSPTSPRLMKLAEQGVEFAGRRLKLPSV